MSITEAGIELKQMGNQPRDGRYRFEYDQTTTAASMAVVAALADVLDVGPTQLAPLEGSFDTGALDTLFATASAENGGVTVTLSVEGYTVTVRSGGVVTLSPSDGTGVDNRAAA